MRGNQTQRGLVCFLLSEKSLPNRKPDDRAAETREIKQGSGTFQRKVHQSAANFHIKQLSVFVPQLRRSSHQTGPTSVPAQIFLLSDQRHGNKWVCVWGGLGPPKRKKQPCATAFTQPLSGSSDRRKGFILAKNVKFE